MSEPIVAGHLQATIVAGFGFFCFSLSFNNERNGVAQAIQLAFFYSGRMKSGSLSRVRWRTVGVFLSICCSDVTCFPIPGSGTALHFIAGDNSTVCSIRSLFRTLRVIACRLVTLVFSDLPVLLIALQISRFLLFIFWHWRCSVERN